ncbi:MAG: bifunctional diguanylate cyclase/phosphodiesterase [Chromatiales bacterium]|nr:bifunctional diguanylate cyclase/phosphodiesterase [Chromatiales bacterium]
MSNGNSLRAVLEQLFSASFEPVIATSGDNHIIVANGAFFDLVRMDIDELTGEDLLNILKLKSLVDPIEEALISRRVFAQEVSVTIDDQNEVQLQLRVSQLPEGERLWVLNPKSKYDRSRDAQFDRLTGLPSQFLFDDRAEQAVITANRHNKSIALLRMGIDHFNRINEGLGHKHGDEVLKEIASRLQHTIRNSDTVARLGGDQFGFIMAISAIDDSILVAEKVLEAVNEPIIIDGHTITLTASIGITLYPDDGKEMSVLLQHAESAMRHVKSIGGHNFQFFAAEMDQRARARIQLENRMRQALTNNEFVLYYQPKVDIESNSIVGAEALIRWNDPEKGMISPVEFIPVAEESGLIVPIGKWVLEEACRQNKIWIDAGLPTVKVSINMAAPQFRDRNIVEQVREVIEKSGLPPKYMEIEITESMLVGDIETVIEKLHGLRDMGLDIAIDDFGTGYSSLSYLSRFPITTLKIDRAFVHDLESNKNTAEIARAIIALSQGLELEVVAEGAENAAHIDFLKEQGCNTVQGFFYSRPVTAEAFAELLKAGVISGDDVS